MILVAGASSKLGQQLISMLTEKGYQVRALTRAPQKLNFAHLSGVEVFEGDMRQLDTTASVPAKVRRQSYHRSLPWQELAITMSMRWMMQGIVI